jgi:hypothetical protein
MTQSLEEYILKYNGYTYHKILEEEKNLPKKIESNDKLIKEINFEIDNFGKLIGEIESKLEKDESSIEKEALKEFKEAPKAPNFGLIYLVTGAISIGAGVITVNFIIPWVIFILLNILVEKTDIAGNQTYQIENAKHIKQLEILKSKAKLEFNNLKTTVQYSDKLNKLETEQNKLLQKLSAIKNDSAILLKLEKQFVEIKRRAKERERSAKIAAFDNRARSGSQTVKTDLLKSIKNKRNWKCPYCYTDNDLNKSVADHIHPINKGGLTTPQNIVLVCIDCNKKKSNFLLRVFCKKNDIDFNEVCERLEKLGKDA